MIMKRKHDYYFIRLLKCCPVMVIKEYFDWFLIHGRDPANSIDVIRSYNMLGLCPLGSICATQIRVLSCPDLDTDDDDGLPF